MNALENKIPPPLVALIFAFAMWGISIALPTADTFVANRWFSIIILVLVGNVFSLSGIVSFRRAKTTVNPLKPDLASSLVCTGIYRISRNPMYVGFALYLLAWAIFLGSFSAFGGIIGFILYINKYQIEPEERALGKIFGEQYTDYQTQVRRWL